MKLIDADVLKEELTSHFDIELEPVIEKEVLRMIDEQETISVASPKWISVKDRLPDDDGEVLAVNDGEVLIANYFCGWYRYIEDECGDMIPTYDIDVSYWMPLPEPPEDGV